MGREGSGKKGKTKGRNKKEGLKWRKAYVLQEDLLKLGLSDFCFITTIVRNVFYSTQGAHARTHTHIQNKTENKFARSQLEE